MRLKKIKLAGFKSFVDPTTIPFPDDMTAVVGPNGCGKSNVIDAVRWVLGESSAKNLRGDAMTDVIFNGSTARKPVSQCSVELVFDNSSGRIQGEFAGYNELSVKRIVTREAQSSYLLNNTKCRRRDVTDLFLGTGLGPRSYAIIEQGMISRLIESKPQDLRVFIEEAAGVSKYKERRRETETRIRHTKENLDRLEDVRGELGQQLEKLQRQASAAKRFKELKHKERRYKAELAAIRWLKHNNKIESLESDIAQKTADVEAYVATQRNEEKDITDLKQQQQDLKQHITDVQQQVFVTGSEISRIEQNQIHTKQRRQQIEQESQTLQQAITDNESHHQQNLQKIALLSEQLAEAEPEKELLGEQEEQAQTALLDAEEQFNQQQHQWRNQEQDFNQQKQQAQSCHGKIQALMSMQMRTQQRIGELKDELREVEDHELLLQIEVSQEHQRTYQQQVEEHSITVERDQQHETDLQIKLKKVEQQQLRLTGELQSVMAQLSALNALQENNQVDQKTEQYLQQYKMNHQSWWQTLDIESGWEQAFEVITEQWQNAILMPETIKQAELAELSGTRWLFHDQFTQDFPAQSIASKLNEQRAPSWLTHIMFASTLEQGLAQLPEMTDFQSVVTKDGYWLGKGWMMVGSGDQQAGLLKRASQIKVLENQQQAMVKDIEQINFAVEQAEESLVEAKQTALVSKQQVEQAKQNVQQTTNQIQLFNQQQQQNLSRNARLSSELIKQQDTALDEEQQLEELALQAEELEQKVEILQEQQLEFETKRQQQQHQVVAARANLEAQRNKLHQLALHLQSVQSQYQSLITNQTRDSQLLSNMQEKFAQLTVEFAELALPLEEQQEKLQELLEKKASLGIEQQGLNEQLTTVEDKLQLAEKGQQGVTDKIQAMLSEIQSIKLECEGCKVRANGVLEQFQDMKQNLKTVLENLPEEATETSWQAQLDKTIGAVTRLGAVNLAAVEEYDIQAQRKKHLDDQNDDLVSALDILEQAIRKIDKETRARFKQTFDQVNEDLKLLFPKVFGGGSAYLELTDDDLLETGVTIMARPPGKKNSTIHLLSGGEKALTALSLVFAIFRLNPAPFCLLDEVDAPLDDANVGRFCKLVSEMSKTVQFIYITHNKIAMEMASHLTGVTMAEPGVSRMVAVDVDEAVAIAQA